MPFSSLPDALDDIRAGKMVIVTDDSDRENEGDLVFCAEDVTPEMIAFMAVHARGLICTPVSEDIAQKLDFGPMISNPISHNSTTCNFTISVDSREGVSTGISAADRAKTIRDIVGSTSIASDFVCPGHVFPLRGKKGGVLVRAGHTEASLDLCQLTGKREVAVICEIMNDDGTMARLGNIEIFAKKHNLKIISIEDLIAYRQSQEILVEETATASIPTEFGVFDIHVFREKHTGKEHSAMVMGDISSVSDPLVRVHSECLTGDVFHSLRCDCYPQLHGALQSIASEGVGVLLRMSQEGRGIGLSEKIKAYNLQDTEQLDTVEANKKLGFKDDLRDYGIGAQILHLLGVKKMRLLTNNPRKIVGISGYDLEVTDRVPLLTKASHQNKKYLETKKQKLGHLL